MRREIHIYEQPCIILFLILTSQFYQQPYLKKKRMRNNLGLRAVNALSVINHPDRMVQKASDVSAADWQYQTRKN